MLKTLDNILLNDNVVESFHTEYSNPKFNAWINSILPEIEDCANTNQDNPWHIYNCLDHILHSVEELNKLTLGLDDNIRRMLSYTMFLHDIGKPKCKIRRYSKLYRREVDSFFNHNLAGVEIARRVLTKFDFDKVSQEIITTLIKEHDMFMFITLEDKGNPHHRVLDRSLVKEKIDELSSVIDGQTMLSYLLKVGRADNLAQNPKMTQDSLKLLEKMDNLLYQITDKQSL